MTDSTDDIPYLIAIGKTSYNTVMPETDFTLMGTFENAIITSVANISYVIKTDIAFALNQLSISGCDNSYLESWGEALGVPRLQPSTATGMIIRQDSFIAAILKNTTFKINNNTYTNSLVAYPINYLFTIISSTFDSGNNRTIFTLANTLDDNGVRLQFIPTVIIKLKDSPNTPYTIKDVLSSTQFTVDGNVVQTPATKFTMSNIYNVTVTSAESGSIMNADKFTDVSTNLIAPNAPTKVSLGGIIGGTDLETNDAWRTRLLFRAANANKGIFNDIGFKRFLDTNNLDYTSKVLRGYNEAVITSMWATVYLLKSDGTALNQDELDNITDLFYNSQSGLAYPNDSQAHPMTKFLSPNLINVPISVDNLQPDYPSLRAAINNRLNDFFINSLVVGQSLPKATIEALIAGTFDELNNTPKDFTLTAPANDVTAAVNEKLSFNGIVNFGN